MLNFIIRVQIKMKNNDNNSTNDMPVSSGLLINVIRTLTTSVSEDQKNLEKSRLERGYTESGQTIDTLLKGRKIFQHNT